VLYQSMIALSSWRMFRRLNGTRMHRSPSAFSVRMNRSITAMLPYWPMAPNLGLIFWRRHQRLNALHQNCDPLSQTMYLGLALFLQMVVARKTLTCLLLGCLRKTVMPMTFREK